MPQVIPPPIKNRDHEMEYISNLKQNTKEHTDYFSKLDQPPERWYKNDWMLAVFSVMYIVWFIIYLI